MLARRWTWILPALVAAPSFVAAQQSSEEPREVKLGLLLADLIDVEGAEQSFTADLFVLASWHDPELAGGTEARTLDLEGIWHPTLLVFNRRNVSETMPRKVRVQPDGSVSYLQRYSGEFSNPMNLHEFPRDRQELFIWLVSPSMVGTPVTLVPDESVVTLRTEAPSASPTRRAERSFSSSRRL